MFKNDLLSNQKKFLCFEWMLSAIDFRFPLSAVPNWWTITCRFLRPELIITFNEILMNSSKFINDTVRGSCAWTMEMILREWKQRWFNQTKIFTDSYIRYPNAKGYSSHCELDSSRMKWNANGVTSFYFQKCWIDRTDDSPWVKSDSEYVEKILWSQ